MLVGSFDVADAVFAVRDSSLDTVRVRLGQSSFANIEGALEFSELGGELVLGFVDLAHDLVVEELFVVDLDGPLVACEAGCLVVGILIEPLDGLSAHAKEV